MNKSSAIDIKRDLESFKELIKAYCGLQFNDTDTVKLSQAIVTRISATGIPISKYLSTIKSNRTELDDLVNLLTINETYFFREKEQIDLLINNIIPELIKKRTKKNINITKPIKILSAGCSSGEEPYSLAMALLDAYAAQTEQMFSLVGVDIDDTALDKAEKGVYTEFSFRNLAELQQNKYFIVKGKNYEIVDAVKKLVSLHKLNLFAQTDVNNFENDFDIILFRNVSIYFDAATRLKVLNNFKLMMAPDAVLMVGIAETLANDLGVFHLVKDNELFYFSNSKVVNAPEVIKQVRPTGSDALKTEVPVQPLTAPSQWQTIIAKSKHTALKKEIKATLEQANQAILEQNYDNALRLLQQALEQDNKLVEALVLKSYVLLQRNELDAAKNLALSAYNADAWLADTLLLLGLIERANGELELALSWFKKALYVHQDCWLAHYYIAGIYSEIDLNLALRSYRIVDNLLQREVAANYLSFIPRPVPPAAARLVCKHKLTDLGSSKSMIG